MRGLLRTLIPVALAAVASACFERGGKHADEPPRGPPAAGEAASAVPISTGRADEAEGRGDPEATVVVGLEAEPAHLNPLLGDALAARVTLGDVYQGLLCHAGVGEEPAPCLARSLEVDAAGRVYRFELRPDVAWHDGAPFGAGDVLFTLGLLGAPEPPPTLLVADFDDLVEVSTEGESVVVVSFSGFRIGRLDAFARLPILPRHRFEGTPPAEILAAAASRRPIGTGPLRVAAWRAGEAIELARHPGAWGPPAAAARVIYRILPAREQLLAELAAGRLDVAIGLPLDEALAFAEGRDEVRSFPYAAPAYLAAVFNTRRSGLASAEVRRALAMLLDRDGIARRLFRGGAVVVSGPFPPGSPLEDPAVRPLPFDRDAAAALLGGRPVRATLSVPAGSRAMERIADIWASDARPHAELAVDRIPYADLLARAREGRFDVALLAFTTSAEVDLYHRFHSSQVGGENYGAVRDAELDRLLEAARAEPDPARRRDHQRAIHRRLHELQVYAFIASDARAGLARAGVGGLDPGPYGLRGATLSRRVAAQAEP